MLIDLHTHTRPLSWDSELTADALIEGARAAGLDGVCLTEHDFFWDTEAVELLRRRHDFLVLPGVEINTEGGHVLCYGLAGYIFGMHRWPELARHVAGAGGVMLAAHPYRRQLPPRVLDAAGYEVALLKALANPGYELCAGIEVLNGRGSEHENAFSARLCERLDLPASAASDSHRANDIGRCATRFERDVDSLDALIEELRAGRFWPARRDADGLWVDC